MDVSSPKLHLAAWTVMRLLCVFSHEVTVKQSDLKLCEEDERVCVTDLRDCRPSSPSSVQKTLNMSCYYQMSHRSVTCGWSQEWDSHTDADVSLIFSSKFKILSCWGILNPAANLNITARMKSYLTGREVRSRPHTVFLYDAVKPSQPVLTVLGCTDDSVLVSWRSTSDGSCQLRYRVADTRTWTQAPDSVPAHRDQTLTYKIQDLLPFTVYRAAVACRRRFSSDWSSDVTARTLDRVPSQPPEVCYRVEKTDSAASFRLHLMWKDLCDARGRILGYQVSYEPVKKKQQLQDRFVQNVTEATALLVVKDGNCSVTVKAFNAAGFGPAARLGIDTRTQSTLPSVRNLWVSSSFPATKGLLVQWKNPTAPPFDLPVSHVAVRWRSETRPSTDRWTTVDRFTNSTVLQDVDPDQSYIITVFPVYNQQCGAAQSLPASLKQGALMEAGRLQVVGVSKTTVTVVWAWQRKSGPIRVNRYSVMLRKDSEGQTLPLWPDQWQHTILNLKPNTEYSLLLLADNVSRNILPVRTDFDEVPAVATATPLLLLAVTVFIISILSRIVYKSYFFPQISSPRSSTAGRWLRDPNHQRSAERNILDMEDFQVTDALGEKSVIRVGADSVEEDPHEDASLLPVHHLISEYVSEDQQASLQTSDHLPDGAFLPAGGGEADAAPLHPTPGAQGCLPQRQETSHQREAAAKCHSGELRANASRPGVHQCVENSSSLVKGDVETGSGCSHLICDTGYIVNSC